MLKSVSIITAVHNCLAMNELYWEVLSTQTTCPFQLIVIDNHSTDGSETFFSTLSKGPLPTGCEITYVRNDKNQGYPESQIQGMRYAKHDVLCFFNNDIWLPKAWNHAFQEMLKKDTRLVLSGSGQEAQPRQVLSNQLKNRWKRVTFLSKIWQKLFLKSEKERLWKSLHWMYGDLENFKSPTPKSANFPGIKGDSVVFHKDLLKLVPNPLNENIEAADWHLYLQLASLHSKDPSIPLPLVLTDLYVHHFGRYSARQEYEPLGKTYSPLSDYWTSLEVKTLWWGNFLAE